MAKHTFAMTDVTGDARVLARSAMGYDWNYYADDETAIFGSGSDATIAWDGNSLEVSSAATNFSAAVTLVAQNLYLGAETAFATTEPTSAIIIKQGTAFAGAIVTSSAIQANATVLRKVIADGTISNVG